MKSTCLLILASLTVCNLALSGGQDDAGDGRTIDDIILQRAESLLLGSILKKIKDGDGRTGAYNEDLEKRQHPGRREEDEDEDYVDLQKRQHPGKRSMMGQTSENPIVLLGELSKRQHPGKRYLLIQSKRQHPGKRHPGAEDGGAYGDPDADGDLRELEKRQHPGKRFWDNSNPDLDNMTKSHAEEKRQHPGKRSAPEEDLVEAE
uniref:Pro-thyrotropin-releasing hormone n=1 Tax=Myripristis murdjan TaxID=586833 RepID=A0A667YG81_9TELE